MKILTARHLAIATLFALGLSCSHSASAQDSRYAPASQWEEGMITPPACMNLRTAWDEMYVAGATHDCPANMHELWLHDLRHWREERRIRIGYDGSRYELPALKWTQSSFMQPQAMVHDRYLFDVTTGKYTVDRYVADLEKRFGGIDAVLIWPTYPNIGIDNRNQHDLISSMPGGIPAVKAMVADFHRRNIRVFFPMMMWDQGTREPDKSWADEIAALMKEVGADGINGDTQDGIPENFVKAAEAAGHPLAFEPEGSFHDEAINWDLMNWGQYSFSFLPKVDRYKWLETRHMTNISDRWNRAKTDDLQYAFFNGVGWESWENVWGIWNGMTAHDAEATRRVAALERQMAAFLVSPDWEPLYPMHNYGVFASRWPKDDETFWSIINRNEYNVNGPQISIPWQEEMRYYDLYHGVELKPEHMGRNALLNFSVEAHGYGAILASKKAPDAAFLERMKQMTAKPLASYDDVWRPLPQKMIDIAPTEAVSKTPHGMVRIEGGDFHFAVKGVEIEGENAIGVDVQYPWEDSPRRFHEQHMQMPDFFIDRYPVTNAQFKQFLDATHYHPADDGNFLADWEHGTFPEGWDDKPVTWVSIEDARAYAKWAGKRLPHEWEWQYVAEGSEARTFPWGRQWKSDAVPTPDTERNDMRGPDNVYAHPLGNTPQGVADMVGNVWQWTDEWQDEHTRAAVIRGGSYYLPQGSIWYFPQTTHNDEHGKYLLMAPSLDRAATIGFRCVKDAVQ